jgi:hypothetical protein
MIMNAGLCNGIVKHFSRYSMMETQDIIGQSRRPVYVCIIFSFYGFALVLAPFQFKILSLPQIGGSCCNDSGEINLACIRKHKARCRSSMETSHDFPSKSRE